MIEKIGLIDVDGTSFPNLALMKLSSFFKHKGYTVEFYKENSSYLRVFESKVFRFTKPMFENLDNVIKGGTGNSLKIELPYDVEHACPDYSLYGLDYSLGFTTRGCVKSCNFCIVSSKEGDIKPHADIDEFLAHDKLVLMDNNILASSHGIDQIDKIIKKKVKVDFNQGLDIDFIDNSIASRLSNLKFLKPLRLACDDSGKLAKLHEAVKHLRYNNCTPSRYFVYVLVRDVEDALERVKYIKSLGLDAFAQPFRDFDKKKDPTKEQKMFARWVNHKAIFRKVTWEEYLKEKNKLKKRG